MFMEGIFLTTTENAESFSCRKFYSPFMKLLLQECGYQRIVKSFVMGKVHVLAKYMT